MTLKSKPRPDQIDPGIRQPWHELSVIQPGSYLTWIGSFNPKGSWVKKSDKTDYLLKHEQTHFDIYEVNARKLREELQTKKLTPKNAQDVLNRLVDKYQELNIKTQERYDSETEHSIKEAKQKKWNDKIAAELEELSAYKDASFKVTID